MNPSDKLGDNGGCGRDDNDDQHPNNFFIPYNKHNKDKHPGDKGE
jgi:hypothetical protein